MPLCQNQDAYTMRIKQGTVDIRRVYLNDTLMWGLYDVTYNLAGGTQGNNPVNEYVWGVAEIALPTPKWTGNTYYTKFNGWYEGNTYVTAVPAITKDFHKDIELYAQWTQRKYTYSGTYQYDIEEWIEGDGGGESGTSSGGVPFTAFTNTTPLILHTGQCTRFCLDRAKGAFGHYPVKGGPSDVYMASHWIYSDNINTAEGWHRGSGSPGPGDILVFSDSHYGHVVFIETTSVISQSNVRYPDGSGPGTWAQCYVDNGYTDDGVHPRYNAELFSRVAKSAPYGGYLGMTLEGFLTYTGNPDGGSGGGTGGEGHLEVTTYNINVSETEATNQRSPSVRTPSGVPSGAVNGRWASLYKKTYTRTYNYPSNNWGSWQNPTSGWDTSGSDWY